jgi:hypothetical protein
MSLNFVLSSSSLCVTFAPSFLLPLTSLPFPSDLQENKQELLDMGFEFDPNPQLHSWNAVKSALESYKKRHGDLLVPPSFVVPTGESVDWALGLEGHRLGHVVNCIKNHNHYKENRDELIAMGFEYIPNPNSKSNSDPNPKSSPNPNSNSNSNPKSDPNPSPSPSPNPTPNDMKREQLSGEMMSANLDSSPLLSKSAIGIENDPKPSLYEWEVVKRALVAYKGKYGDLQGGFIAGFSVLRALCPICILFNPHFFL